MTPAAKSMHPVLKMALEMGPLVVFFLVNSKFGIFPGTAVFMVATVIALGVSYAIARTIPVMPMVTAVFVMIFGGLTLYLEDDLFIKLKPTIVNALFSAILLAGLLSGRLFIKLIFESAFHLTDRGWTLLTRAWIGFFAVLALLNEIVWRNFSTDTWVTFKVFGVMPLTIVFTLTLLPLITRHMIQPADAKSDVDNAANSG